MILQLKSCIVRSWSMEDAAALAGQANNYRIWINLRDAFPHPYTLADAVAFLTGTTARRPETAFAIAVGSAPIGGIGLRLGEDVHRKTAELGYWLGESFWGRGIMSEAVAAFTDYALAAYDLVRIYAEPIADNRASARVLEKAGFNLEARLAQNAFKAGRVKDQLLYARLREAPGD